MKYLFVAAAIVCSIASAQQKPVEWSADEKPIADQIHGLRALPDDVRAGTTKDLALKIRKLPSTENKLRLAVGLSGLSTEGDFGHDTLQEVATTLAETLRERPVTWSEPNVPRPTAGILAPVKSSRCGTFAGSTTGVLCWSDLPMASPRC